MNVSGEETINKVVCNKHSPMPAEEISCGYNQIIDILSATVSYVEEEFTCSVDSLLPVIQRLPSQCKSSTTASVANIYIM